MSITSDKCFSCQMPWIVTTQTSLHSPDSLTYSDLMRWGKYRFTCTENPCLFCAGKTFQAINELSTCISETRLKFFNVHREQASVFMVLVEIPHWQTAGDAVSPLLR